MSFCFETGTVQNIGLQRQLNTCKHGSPILIEHGKCSAKLSCTESLTIV